MVTHSFTMLTVEHDSAVQRECLFAFHGNNCYANTPQHYVISTLSCFEFQTPTDQSYYPYILKTGMVTHVLLTL
jgi:hypothetical protein